MPIFYTENKQTGQLIFSFLLTMTKKRKTKKWNQPDINFVFRCMVAKDSGIQVCVNLFNTPFFRFISIQSKIIHSIFICNNYFATHVCQQPLFSEKLQTFFCLSLSLDTNWQLRNKEQHSAKTIQSQSGVLKSRPCENSLADFCTSACLKAKSTSFILKKQMAKLSEVQKCECPLENFHMVSTLLNIQYSVRDVLRPSIKAVSCKIQEGGEGRFIK